MLLHYISGQGRRQYCFITFQDRGVGSVASLSKGHIIQPKIKIIYWNIVNIVLVFRLFQSFTRSYYDENIKILGINLFIYFRFFFFLVIRNLKI